MVNLFKVIINNTWISILNKKIYRIERKIQELKYLKKLKIINNIDDTDINLLENDLKELISIRNEYYKSLNDKKFEL